MRSRILCCNSTLKLKRTPTPFEIFVFIFCMCAFQVKLLSMRMPKNLVEMEKETVVLLIIIGIYNFVRGMKKHSSRFVSI